MSAQTLLTRDLLAASIARLNTRVPAAQLCAEHAALLDRAIGIVMAKPYLQECRRDGDTMYRLTVSGLTAQLQWSRCGSTIRGGLLVEKCRFPARLLDMNDGDLCDWRDGDEARGIAADVRRAAE